MAKPCKVDWKSSLMKDGTTTKIPDGKFKIDDEVSGVLTGAHSSGNQLMKSTCTHGASGKPHHIHLERTESDGTHYTYDGDFTDTDAFVSNGRYRKVTPKHGEADEEGTWVAKKDVDDFEDDETDDGDKGGDKGGGSGHNSGGGSSKAA